MRRICQITFFVAIALSLSCEKCKAGSVDADLTITYEQKLILDKFKAQVEKYLPKEYMKKEIYLIRWLRAKNFHLEGAQSMLLDNLKWRKDNKIDTIHQEDWAAFRKAYRYYTDGRDKDKRPIAFLSLGSWDVRNAIVTGQREKLSRYIDMAVDQVANQLLDMQDRGENVTQVDFVVNLAGFNLIQQGCLQCIPFYIHFVSTYEQHFPGMADKIIILNTPEIFQTILSVIRPFMSPKTRKSLKVYGQNRRDWEPIIFKDFDRDQLPEEIWGTQILND